MTDRVIALTELRAGSGVFKSNGHSYVKVTNDGATSVLKLAIKSTGVTEIIERARANAPRPPSAKRLFTHDTPEGRTLKLRPGEKRWMEIYDFTDPDYVKAREEYDEKMILGIVSSGLDVPVRDAEGLEIDDPGKKIAALRELGMTLGQYQQIVEDVQGLTTLSDKDREDFFGKNSASEGVTTS